MLAYLGLDVHSKRGTAGKTHRRGRQWPGEVNEVFLIDSHIGRYISVLTCP